MNQKRVYKSYPKEFKEEAVALVTDQGYTVVEAAKSLGIRATNFTIGRLKLKHRSRMVPYQTMGAVS
jgi:transposase-like protein